MDEVLQIIKEAKADGEAELREALKVAGKDTGTIDAAVGVYRLLSAFRDSMTEEDLASMAKALKFESAKPAEGEGAAEGDAGDGSDSDTVGKSDDGAAPAEPASDAGDVQPPEDVDKPNEEIESLKARIAELEKNKRRAELAAMVQGLRIGKSESELVDTLEAVEKSGGDIGVVVETFRSAHNVIQQGLGEIGSDLPSTVGGDAFTKMEAAVARIMKDEGVSRTKAWDILDQREPDLVAEYYKD